ncbi:molybdenum cofactor guanylyltransferase MobA [Paraferrimonas sedimenticola]|uniref:Molybdenum cofactor guanylyltransferase n=1 Tax=Paraferrimonas sedimenticola TaxID=375674 RepID=A0AA37W1Z7_9GAMM|nr:molybdenum cofactor guanylyltransferase MobA [Paraferrimonas sedimenticola]GLP97540.1 molybdenum cofactor guanylyltransferase [Paraferrimonas sedimenticola]
MAEQVAAVVLAGGLARRMGGNDKGLVQLGQRSMIEYAIDCLSAQVEQVVINANRNLEKYAQFGLPLVSDESNDFAGPLAGVAAAMTAVNSQWLVSAPCDCPLLPSDLVERMLAKAQQENALVAVAHDGERPQHVVLLVHTSLYQSINEFLARGDRKIVLWYRQHPYVEVDFSDCASAFVNVNTPEQCAEVEALLKPNS